MYAIVNKIGNKKARLKRTLQMLVQINQDKRREQEEYIRINCNISFNIMLRSTYKRDDNDSSKNPFDKVTSLTSKM